MLRKFALVACLCMIAFGATYAQLYNSIGLSPSIQQATLYRPITAQGPFRVTHFHFTYFPRYNVQIGENGSISFGSILSFGPSFINNEVFGIKKTYLSIDPSFVLDYNVGFKAIPPTDDKYGFYFGAGFGFNKIFGIDTLAPTKQKVASAGIMARAGVRVGFPESENNRGLTFGLFYRAGMTEEKYQMVGLNVFFDF